jgi:hypothetical protein
MYTTMRIALGSVLLLALVSCGGSSSDSIDIEGAWSGSYTIGSVFSPVPLYAVIKTGGSAILYDSNGLMYVVQDTPASTDVDTSATVYPPYDFIFTGSGKDEDSLPVAVRGTASDDSISGNMNLDGGVASFNLHRLTSFSGTPSIVSGTWSGNYIGSQDVAFQVSDTGAITGTDVFSCSFTGQITQVGTEDLFTVELTSTGPTPVCGHHFTGYAYESGSDETGNAGHATGTYYYIATYDSNEGLLAEVKVQ